MPSPWRTKGLTTVQDSLFALQGLETLELAFNRFTTLPSVLFSLSNLEILGLFGNQLLTIPAEILLLTKMQRLSLGRNQISAIPNLDKLSSLAIFAIERNNLVGVPFPLSFDPLRICQGYDEDAELRTNCFTSCPMSCCTAMSCGIATTAEASTSTLQVPTTGLMQSTATRQTTETSGFIGGIDISLGVSTATASSLAVQSSTTDVPSPPPQSGGVSDDIIAVAILAGAFLLCVMAIIGTICFFKKKKKKKKKGADREQSNGIELPAKSPSSEYGQLELSERPASDNSQLAVPSDYGRVDLKSNNYVLGDLETMN